MQRAFCINLGLFFPCNDELFFLYQLPYAWLTNLDPLFLDFYLQLYAIDIGINTNLAFYSVGACSENDSHGLTATYHDLIFFI